MSYGIKLKHLRSTSKCKEGILTLSHSLEIQFTTVASKTCHSASPDLEHVDGSLLEATDDHCVGRASDDS